MNCQEYQNYKPVEPGCQNYKPVEKVERLARVRLIERGSRVATNGHYDTFCGSMLEKVGEVMSFKPSSHEGWWRSNGFYWHESWLDFDYQKPAALPHSLPCRTISENCSRRTRDRRKI